MTTFTIKQKDLKAVAHAMATKDIRYYLNGVLVEHNGSETRLAATDGHRLHVVLEELTGLMIEPVSAIIPRDFVVAMLKIKPVARGVDVEIVLSTYNGKIEARFQNQTSMVTQAIDGKFPDYCRVIPSMALTGQAANYNNQYLLDADKGLCDYLELSSTKTHGIGFGQNGNGSGVLSVPGFTAVVMPMRTDPCTSADTRMTKPMAKPEAMPEPEAKPKYAGGTPQVPALDGMTPLGIKVA